MKHTPGPWRIDNHAQILGKSDFVGESVLGRVYCGDIFPNDELPECTANAKLISAAPELLEACKMAFDNMRNGESKTRYRLITCLNALDEAIKKATE